MAQFAQTRRLLRVGESSALLSAALGLCRCHVNDHITAGMLTRYQDSG
jgi:hypothetical protein